MRATRAYLAGFGTSGSLLAGAALMFVLASAFVAFQGWPQVAGQSSPVSVVIPRADVGTGSPASRVLSAAVAAHPRGGAVAGRAGVAHRAISGGRVHRGTPGLRTGGSHTPATRNPATHQTPGSTHQPTPSSCSSNCGSGSGSGALSKVSKTVSSATSSAGSTVGSTVTAVKNLLSGKGSVTGVVKSVNGTVGNTVSNVVSTTKSVLSGVTKGLP